MTDRPERAARALWQPTLVALGVIVVFWKIALTTQYTFLANHDMAHMVVPRLETIVYAIQHGSVPLWNPYELFGEPTIGQVQPGLTSPFTFLFALAPLHNGQIQFFWINLWFVLIHCLAGVFAWRFFRELGCTAGPSVIAGILFATMGYFGNTGWPNNLTPAIMAPLIFLFLLRSMRGRAPMKNAAWAGVMLGIAWLCGHHDPPVMMTYAVAAIGFLIAVSRADRRALVSRMSVLFAAMALVSAVQILPAVEYGKLATRWTTTGARTWNDAVPFTEHESASLPPTQLVHVLVPGGNINYSDPFVGVVGLTLAVIAIRRGFRRLEIRFLVFLSLAALLWAMAGSNVLYGPIYAFLPLIEKTREPIVALFLFDLAVAALAAMGAEIIFSEPTSLQRSRTVRLLLWLSAALAAFVVLNSLRPPVDPRLAMTAFLALLLAGVFRAWSTGILRRGWALVLIAFLVIIEQGLEAPAPWAYIHDSKRMEVLRGLSDTEDLAEWLRKQPGPKRLHKDEKDVPFDFGDWYRFDSAYAYGASMLTQTADLGWWNERLGHMYGLNYTLSRTRPREGLVDVFTGKSGIKIWYDPAAFPRAWTVHQIVFVPNQRKSVAEIAGGTFDLRTTALTEDSPPALESCPAQDNVTAISDQAESFRATVEMACKGLLVVSDSFYPGWHAAVDGRSVEIRKVDHSIRGVIVPSGRHTVTMNYRPLSVYLGFLCTLTGLGGAIMLQRRKEQDGPDLFYTNS